MDINVKELEPMGTSRMNTTVPIAWAYLFAGLGMMFLVVIAIVVITWTRPTQDNTGLITVVIAFGTSTFVSMATFIKGQETKHVVREVAYRVDGRLSQLLKSESERAENVGEKKGAGIVAQAVVETLKGDKDGKIRSAQVPGGSEDRGSDRVDSGSGSGQDRHHDPSDC